MVHCGSAFEPGSSGLPYYCSSIFARSCCTWRASWVNLKQKLKKQSSDISLGLQTLQKKERRKKTKLYSQTTKTKKKTIFALL